jgi:hypothetical protein
MNRFGNARKIILTNKRTVVFRARNKREYRADELAAAAKFGVLNGRPEFFTEPVQNLLVNNVWEFNQNENIDKRDVLLSVLCSLPPPESPFYMDNLLRIWVEIFF